MKMKIWLLSFIGSCFVLLLNAQPAPIKAASDKGFTIGINAIFPVGDFSSSHIGGIGIEASPSRRNYGSLRKKKMLFTYNGGVAYYLGKKETISSYIYKYPGYIFIHAYGGLWYAPAKKIIIKLLTGPALGIYNSDTRFNIGGKLEGGYMISDRVAIGPGILIMKEPGADPLWAFALRTAIDF